MEHGPRGSRVDDCPDCRWTNVGTLADPDQWLTVEPCPAHIPPPSPLAMARAELDDIDRATGLADLPGWRPTSAGPAWLRTGPRTTTSRGPQ